MNGSWQTGDQAGSPRIARGRHAIRGASRTGHPSRWMRIRSHRPQFPPSGPISVCAFTLVGAAKTNNSQGRCAVDRPTSIAARCGQPFRLAQNAHWCVSIEGVDDPAAVGLQRQDLSRRGVELRPVGLTWAPAAIPRRRTGSSSRSSDPTAPAARVQRRSTADVEQVAQFQRMAGTHRERQLCATLPAPARRDR